MKISEFIDRPQFTSTEDLLTKSQHVADGAGLLSSDESSLYAALGELPPHAEYDFNVRHFQARLSPGEIANVTAALVQRGQFVAYVFSDPLQNWFSEEGFLRFSQKPLIVHLTDSLDETAVRFQMQHGERAEIVHVGIQPHCTPREHLDQTLRSQGSVLPLKTLQQAGFLAALESHIHFGFQRPTWIRVNLNSLVAGQGGVDSWATGIDVRDLLPALEWLMRQTKIEGISIGPIYDSQPQSLRTGAQLLSTVLFAHSHRCVVTSAHGKKPNAIFS